MGTCGAPGARSGRRDVSATAGAAEYVRPPAPRCRHLATLLGGLTAAPTPTDGRAPSRFRADPIRQYGRAQPTGGFGVQASCGFGLWPF